MGEPRLINGRYRLGPEVGDGALGPVHRGELVTASGFSRPVAIRRLADTLVQTAGFVEALGASLGQLEAESNAGTLSVIDLVTEGDEAFLIVEWCNGLSLRRWVEAHHENGEPAPYGLLLRVACDALFALHALHVRTPALVHGGVGPSSIRIDPSGAGRLARTGIRAALEVAGVDAAWAEARGLRRAAPEPTLSPAADVFAVGLAVYSALAGAPDVTDMPDELRERVVAGRPVDLNLIREDISPVVLRTIERALCPDPAERFESAAAMARALGLILRALPEMGDGVALRGSVDRIVAANEAREREEAERAAQSSPGVESAPAPAPTAKRSAAPPPPPAPPSAKKPKPTPGAEPTLGVRREATDQLDLEELSALRVETE